MSGPLIRTAAASLLALILFGSPRLHAQPRDASLDEAHLQQESVSTAKLPSFSVLSIKRDKLDTGKAAFNFKPDGWSIRKYAPMWLLVPAFDLVSEDRIINAPAWLLDEYYDMEARVDEADIPALAKLTKAQQLVLLQQVFATRFNLKFHYESRDFKVFHLVVAKGGPRQLQPSALTETNLKSIGHFHMKYEDISMPEFCLHSLSTEAKQLVIDKTGLSGRYDFSLHWSRPDELVNGAPSEEPLIFTAVQEQLGLKMVPAVASMKVLVIDHIERPSEN